MKNGKKIYKRLEVQILIAMTLGIFLGLVLPEVGSYTYWMGDTYLKLLKIFLAPLLFLTMINAVFGLGDIKLLGNLGVKTIVLYMVTTLIAVGISLGLMNIFQPGVGVNLLGDTASQVTLTAEKLNPSAFFSQMISDNFMRSLTDAVAIQIIIGALFLAIPMLLLSKDPRFPLVRDFFGFMSDAVLKFIILVIKLTPFGVVGISAKVAATSGLDGMYALIPFSLIVIAALGIQMFISLSILGKLLGGISIIKFLKQSSEALVVGFSTASSNAALGVTMDTALHKMKIKKEVVDFCFPLGASLNSNGTAIYQAAIAIFVAQSVGVDLSIVQQLTTMFIVIIASMGIAGIPGSGIFILASIFTTIGLPVEAIGPILVVDRILDSFRTTLNVYGDLVCAKIVDNFYKREQKES